MSDVFGGYGACGPMDEAKVLEALPSGYHTKDLRNVPNGIGHAMIGIGIVIALFGFYGAGSSVSESDSFIGFVVGMTGALILTVGVVLRHQYVHALKARARAIESGLAAASGD